MPDTTTSTTKKKLTLRDFQKEDVAYMKQNNYRVLVANGQGTGKTIECLAAIAIDRQMLCPVIIVCPASVLWNWCKEARKWCKWARIHPVTNKIEPLPRRTAHIYVVSWALLTERAAELASIGHRLLIADEAHFAKNDEAMRSKVLKALAKRSKHLLLLTGTPLVNSSSELQQLKSYFGEQEPAMIRRLLSDVAPDVPDKTRLTLPVYLRPRHAEEYKKAFLMFDKWLRMELRKRMDAGEAEAAAQRAMAAEALVKIGYLRRLVGIAKTYAAVDWVSRAVRVGEPVVLFAEHQEVVRRIKKMLKRQNIPCVVVAGSTPKSQRQKYVNAFQKGHVSVFIGTKAAHTGITLTRARHLCFVERFWTSADEEQAEDRVRRISQRYSTKIWFLHAMGTVDDRIAEIIETKRRLVAKSIGSEEIDDMEQSSVVDLVANWSKEVNAPVVEGNPMLGLVKSLPSLPDPKMTQAIIFKGSRWNEPSVKAWCKMNRYKVASVRQKHNGWEATIASPSQFRQGSLEIVKVSKLIKIITGMRMKPVRVPRASKPKRLKMGTQVKAKKYLNNRRKRSKSKRKTR
jgi:SNF2 family DNA or RNA helicase